MTTTMTTEHTDVVCPDPDCPDVDACTICDVDICTEHSDNFTTCVDGGLHHDDCANECSACVGAMADDMADTRAVEVWKEGRA